jgi:glutathione S-transferase
MQYVEAKDARSMKGLRLALTVGVPGPWSESAKNIFAFKKIPFVPVAQHAARSNPDLVAWTGFRNAPIAVLDDGPPKANWAEIVALAERLQPEPALLPKGEARFVAWGISAEICGEGGLGWNRRLSMMAMAEKAGASWGNAMSTSYADSSENVAKAPERVAEILKLLAARLHAQQSRGSAYLVGDHIAVCDIHWACFSQLLVPLPHAVNPMPDYLRQVYGAISEVERAALDPILLRHRDNIFDKHLGLPLEF